MSASASPGDYRQILSRPLLRRPRRLCHFDMWVVHGHVQGGEFSSKRNLCVNWSWPTFFVGKCWVVDDSLSLKAKLRNLLRFLFQAFSNLHLGAPFSRSILSVSPNFVSSSSGTFHFNQGKEQHKSLNINKIKNLAIKRWFSSLFPKFLWFCETPSNQLLLLVPVLPLLAYIPYPLSSPAKKKKITRAQTASCAPE